MLCCGKKAVSGSSDADDKPHVPPSEEILMENQNFAELKQQCLQAKKLFVDSTFPPGPRALYYHGVTPPGKENIRWKRPMVSNFFSILKNFRIVIDFVCQPT